MANNAPRVNWGQHKNRLFPQRALIFEIQNTPFFEEDPKKRVSTRDDPHISCAFQEMWTTRVATAPAFTTTILPFPLTMLPIPLTMCLPSSDDSLSSSTLSPMLRLWTTYLSLSQLSHSSEPTIGMPIMIAFAASSR